ncbi:hypothetical protein [Burkholderia sp. Ac-20353]|uniref:hypothetical protein n=1 Tax=Burkholderia sp. Ac-20353 TaxID=2703894 RepID=UPI00197C4943|nr:hypothetical protein [Burkholderia sp. Ac-20353]MBN3791186.1 hypothetical protein [Burkholderia sp. Ac-20353]
MADTRVPHDAGRGARAAMQRATPACAMAFAIIGKLYTAWPSEARIDARLPGNFDNFC